MEIIFFTVLMESISFVDLRIILYIYGEHSICHLQLEKIEMISGKASEVVLYLVIII